MTHDVAQRLAELQAQVVSLRIAVALLGALSVLLLVAALAIWSYVRRLYLLHRSQAHHVEAAGQYARDRLAQRGARELRRRARAAGAPSVTH